MAASATPKELPEHTKPNPCAITADDATVLKAALLCYEMRMARILAAILMCLVALSVTAGTIAHAAEPVVVVCVDSDIASDPAHDSGGSEQVPSDDNKATPHQHGGCHGHHQVAEPVNGQLSANWSLHASLPSAAKATGLVSSGTDPALRPPRA
ncbi:MULTISPECIES: hypothetical protein [Alphaproteobacteria]|jgi:hypothetical protein|uniref:hypothetical protein n=1 Tax=Alphaproteobacteria TaxID=28211 RepID=UPI0006AD38B1|nr:hypothetical protein [Sphingopyxis sp. 113P3]